MVGTSSPSSDTSSGSHSSGSGGGRIDPNQDFSHMYGVGPGSYMGTAAQRMNLDSSLYGGSRGGGWSGNSGTASFVPSNVEIIVPPVAITAPKEITHAQAEPTSDMAILLSELQKQTMLLNQLTQRI